MPKVAKGKRKRAYKPKTRSGCSTCKIRRIKCDETRPSCVRCTSTGGNCDGYCYVTSPQHSAPSTVSILTGPSLDIDGTPHSKRSFAFFLQRTCPQQAGFFGSEFWERFVLQAAYHEPAIRHGVIAIGSLHEMLECQPEGISRSDMRWTFALEQYNLAIRNLLKEGSKPKVDVCIITCILFTCFENMQGRHASAMANIESGAKLIREIFDAQQNAMTNDGVSGLKGEVDFYAPIDVLARILARVDTPTGIMTAGGEHEGKMIERLISAASQSDISSLFSTVDEAKRMFEFGLNTFVGDRSGKVGSQPHGFLAATEASYHHLSNPLMDYHSALKKFIEKNRPSFSPKESIAAKVLQLHILSAYISLNIEYLPLANLPSHDALKPRIEEMLSLAENIIASFPESSKPKQATAFCMDLGLNIPLYTMASQCRDPAIRRKVISLLRSTSRQEGLWNSFLVAHVIERIMELEESAAGETIDLNEGSELTHRASIQPYLELDKHGGRIRYCRQEKGSGTMVHVVEELISW